MATRVTVKDEKPSVAQGFSEAERGEAAKRKPKKTEKSSSNDADEFTLTDYVKSKLDQMMEFHPGYFDELRTQYGIVISGYCPADIQKAIDSHEFVKYKIGKPEFQKPGYPEVIEVKNDAGEVTSKVCAIKHAKLISNIVNGKFVTLKTMFNGEEKWCSMIPRFNICKENDAKKTPDYLKKVAGHVAPVYLRWIPKKDVTEQWSDGIKTITENKGTEYEKNILIEEPKFSVEFDKHEIQPNETLYLHKINEYTASLKNVEFDEKLGTTGVLLDKDTVDMLRLLKYSEKPIQLGDKKYLIELDVTCNRSCALMPLEKAIKILQGKLNSSSSKAKEFSNNGKTYIIDQDKIKALNDNGITSLPGLNKEGKQLYVRYSPLNAQLQEVKERYEDKKRQEVSKHNEESLNNALNTGTSQRQSAVGKSL